MTKISNQDDEIEAYLEEVLTRIEPKRSSDPEENECLTCQLTEMSHIKGLKLTCGQFR